MLRRLLAAALVLGLTACGSNRPLAPVSEIGADRAATAKAPRRAPAAVPARRPAEHRVRAGESLYAIAFRYGLDYRALARRNAISDPDLIYPGQRLRLDANAPALVPRAPRATSTEKKRTGSKAPAKAPDTVTKAPATKPATKQASPAVVSRDALDERRVERWRWPVKGRVIGRFGRAGRQGIHIAGTPGQPVYAAAAGRVVYSGSGLIGYGELIIVKHNKRFLSAYAHNSQVLVKEGDHVDSGQHIAGMGNSGTDKVKLHFEIRRDGKPVNPLRYLP